MNNASDAKPLPPPSQGAESAEVRPKPASQNWWTQLGNWFVRSDNATMVDKTSRLPWLSFGTSHTTSHDVKVNVVLDFSLTTSTTLILLGAMGVYAMRLRAGMVQLTPTLRGRSRRQRAGYQAVHFIPHHLPAPPQQQPSLIYRAARRVLQISAFSLVSLAVLPQAWLASMLVDEEEDDKVVNETLIKGSRNASLTISWPDVRDALTQRHKVTVGFVELGSVNWNVQATYRNDGDLLGLYLTHVDGSKDQIAFSMEIIDASDEERERVLAQEVFSGNWVILPGIASDGKGDCIPVVKLERVEKLRIKFTARGPATKYKNAI